MIRVEAWWGCLGVLSDPGLCRVLFWGFKVSGMLMVRLLFCRGERFNVVFNVVSDDDVG